jgi:PKD repeat protein
MKKILLPIFLILLISKSGFSQNLAKQWDHTYGGYLQELLTGIIHTSDGGFLLGGFAQSDSGADVTEYTRGGRDFWIVKTDSAGNKLWDRRFGGMNEDRMYALDETSDGGFIIGGFTASDSTGDVSEHTRGNNDFWVVRVDSAGNKIWDKRFGGADYEWLSGVRQTPDGGFILGGWTFSDSTGDVSEPNRGSEDFWVVKIDPNGIKQWDKRYGGNGIDELWYLENSSDGGYILGGRTSSDSSGEVSQPSKGSTDYWIVKIDIAGNELWDKRFGGPGNDVFYYMQETTDGGFILGGYTQSVPGGDVTEPSRDTATVDPVYIGDIWIVKTSPLGVKQWDKRYGGDQKEDAFGYIQQTADGGYLFGSASYSNISGDKSENNFGMEQSWFVKLDTSGNKLWDKTIFSDGEDEFSYPLEVDSACYVIANWSFADSTGYKTEDSRGGNDYWFIKFCESSQPQLPVANFSVSNPTLCEGGCFYFENHSYNASTFAWYFPGADVDSSSLVSPFDICYQDTGHYTVTLIAINPNGSDTLESIDIIYISPLPDFTITRSGDTLFAPSYYAQYHWSVNGTSLFNDTLYYLVAPVTGDYTLSVVDTNGCPGSEGILNVNVGLSDLSENKYSVNVFPNPTESILNITGLVISKNGLLEIMDISGRKVYSNTINESKLQLPVNNFNPGIYILHIESGSQKLFLRFIKN